MRRIGILFLTAMLTVSFFRAAAPVSKALANTGEFRALWVASVINLDYPSAPGLSADTLRREADSILNNTAALGFTAVVLQVRPTGDTLYQSKLFPWSAYLSGTQGEAPDGGFDPLAYFIDGAHQRGLELHAWYNPFRVAREASSVDVLSENNPARQNPSWVIAHTDGHLYYNPGIPEVRKLVVDGVREIVDNYDVDGVHFDDYFYPGKTFDDAAAYAAYGEGQSHEDWRRENINSLIRETRDAVHSKKGCRFGVSPQAIWAHASSSPYGSDTDWRGNETFSSQFADTRKWVLSGWVDYVVPQIYWEIGNERSDYTTLLTWWCELVRGTGVDLYIGHATYMLDGYGSAEAWTGTGEILRQIELARSYAEYKGSFHFRYSFIADNAAIAAALKTLYADEALSVFNAIQTVMPAAGHGKLGVGRPSGDTTVKFSHYYIVGSSDPAQALTVNGKEVENRSSLGYFSYYAELKEGENVFTFSQGKQSVTRVITVPAASSATADPPLMERAEIVAGTAFPELYNEIQTPGETVTLRCTAPIGAEVSVRIGGRVYAMSPARSTKPEDGRLYSTSYTVSYTLPAQVPAERLVHCGTPVYTMTYEGRTVSRRATASILCAGVDAPVYAEVLSDAAFVFPGATSSGGPSGELFRGQRDSVQKQQNGQWVLLGSGLWVQRSDLRLVYGSALPEARITSVSYSKGERWDTLYIRTRTLTATEAVWNGKTLTLTVHRADKAPVAVLPSGALMGRVTAAYDDGKAVYTLSPDDPSLFNGHIVEATNGGIALKIKRKPQIQAGDQPLDGFTIVVDAGHGGSDTGALGALGSQYAEKAVNLYVSLKLAEALRSLGAEVLLSRDSDADTELKSRLWLNRDTRPDLFISLHCNSMEHDVNSDDIRGVALFYRETVSEGFAQSLYDSLWSGLDIGKKGCHKSNLYVCRGFWAPSVIVEMGFINNPHDYQWLTDNESQNRMAAAIAEGIVRYFN